MYAHIPSRGGDFLLDRHKYVAELAKLLSGMAAADREAVLRGVNQPRQSDLCRRLRAQGLCSA